MYVYGLHEKPHPIKIPRPYKKAHPGDSRAPVIFLNRNPMSDVSPVTLWSHIVVLYRTPLSCAVFRIPPRGSRASHPRDKRGVVMNSKKKYVPGAEESTHSTGRYRQHRGRRCLILRRIS